MRRLDYIDTLRCVASVAVLVQHLLERVDPVRFSGLLELGPGVFGVVLFFYISGLVIPFSVRQGTTLPSFALRRLFRIYPAYLATLLLMGAWALVGSGAFREDFALAGVGGTLANLLFVQEYVGTSALLGVTWTLSLELVWYGLFALIFYAAGARRLGTIVHAYSLGILLLTGLSLTVGQRLPLGRIGMIGAALVGYCAAEWHEGRRSGRAFAEALALFSVAMVSAQVVSFGYFRHPTISLVNTLVAWLGATAVFALFAGSARLRSGRVARLRPLLFLGTISYSIYLLHGPVMRLVEQVAPGPAMLILVPLFTVLLSWGLFVVVERPGVRLGKHVERMLGTATGSRDAAVESWKAG